MKKKNVFHQKYKGALNDEDIKIVKKVDDNFLDAISRKQKKHPMKRNYI